MEPVSESLIFILIVFVYLLLLVLPIPNVFIITMLAIYCYNSIKNE